ncbi:hypothetical protein AB4Y32_26470 [Paraburkholderia phymatum]|uniref:Uncharacterized protein n=1 Tax=Paraburkholderia phymatum TaxID=148447 RepID=A0ACC6U6W5_9BURK
MASYAKFDLNADYYRAEDRVRNTSGDPIDAARQAEHGHASATSSQ